MALGGQVAIIGSGVVKFGENFDQSLTDMIYEAVMLALSDAKLDRSRLQTAWLGANIHDQLMGRAGRMQVAGARTGLAHNVGGPGAVAAVAVLGQP